MTTYTIFASATGGWLEGEGTSFAAAAGAADSADTTNAAASVGQDRAASVRTIKQAAITFDTSSVDDAETVSSATLSLYGSQDGSTTDFTIEAFAYDWGTSLTTADWRTPTNLSGMTAVATFATSGGFSTSGYNAFTSAGGFPAAINKTGETRIWLASNRTRTSVDPTQDEQVQYHGGAAAGTTQDPKLVIEASSSSPQTLTPSLYTNSQTFHAATVSTTYGLTPGLFTNDQTFYSPTVSATYALTPGLVTNDQTFYSPTVTVGAVTLTPALFTNSATFYSPTVTGGSAILLPPLFTNDQTFYSPTVTPGAVTIEPTLFENAQTFFAATVGEAIVVPPAPTSSGGGGGGSPEEVRAYRRAYKRARAREDRARRLKRERAERFDRYLEILYARVTGGPFPLELLPPELVEQLAATFGGDDGIANLQAMIGSLQAEIAARQAAIEEDDIDVLMLAA